MPIHPVDERGDVYEDGDRGENDIGLLGVDTFGRREDIPGCEQQGCGLNATCLDLERDGEEGEGLIEPVRKRRRYLGGSVADVGGIDVRRVLLVVAVFIGLGLVHGLVTAFAGGVVGVRPLPAEQ